MNPTFLAIALLGFPTAPPSVQIELDVKDGDVVSYERKFTVKVTATSNVSQVEFYVGDDLRETDSSTPYEFVFDTVGEKEGEAKLKFSAYASDGENASKTVTVRIDNGLSKGAQFHVDAAKEALAVSKWDEAIRCSRIALKAQTGFNPARMTMARAYLGKGVLDQAQKFAEDALIADANFLDAADLLSGINLKRAFNTFHRSGEQKETLAIIGGAFKKAVQNRRKILDAAYEKAGTPTNATAAAFADVALRAGKYTAAINALAPAFRADQRQQSLANRLAFAQMRSGRFAEATQTLNDNNRNGGLDAYGWALMATLRTLLGDFPGADDAMRQAVLSDNEDLGVRTAQAFLAIARNRTQTLRQLATNLAKDEGQRSDVNYYLAILLQMNGDFAASNDAFERCVLAEPTNYDMYVQRGNDSLAWVSSGRLNTDQNAYHYAAAKMFYETALEARAESAEALTGMALVLLNEKKVLDALRFARAATAAGPAYAAGQYALSHAASATEAELRAAAERLQKSPRDGILTSEQRAQYLKMLDDAAAHGREAKRASDTAGKLDPANLQGRELPRLNDVHGYFMRHGRIPLIALPK